MDSVRCSFRKVAKPRSSFYAAFAFALAFGFIFPCAQRCFINLDSFLLAAALIGRRLFQPTAGFVPARAAARRPVELLRIT